MYQRYLGWFDGNPANLHPLPPEPTAGRATSSTWAAPMRCWSEARTDVRRRRLPLGRRGGEPRRLRRARRTTTAAQLQADALEQLGYQAESGPWRNFYLTGAQELRRPRAPTGPSGPGGRQVAALLQALTVDMVFDLLGVRLDGPAAEGEEVAIGWRFPDIDQEWTLRLEHSALSSWPVLDGDVEATLTMSRSTLTKVLADPTSLGAALEEGELTIDGDAGALGRLFALLEQPDPRFNIIEP